MGHLDPKYIVRYQKGSDPPRFATLKERTKEAPWGDTCKIWIWGQDNSLGSGEDLLTLTKIPSQIPTNLEEVDKDAVGANLATENMANLWSTDELLGQDDREILVWNHSLKHCYLKSLLILSKRKMILRNLSKVIELPLVSPDYLGSPKIGNVGPKSNS